MDYRVQRIDNILYGPKKDVVIDERGLGRTIFNRMREYKHKILQIDGNTGEQQTYEDINKKLIRIALEMRRRGIKPNDIVLTCSYNSMDTIMSVYATLYLNAITVTLDPSISLRNSTHLLKTIAPKFIFVTEDALDLIEKASAELASKPLIIVMGSHKGYSTLSDFLKPHPEEGTFIPEDVEDVHNVSNIFFSSGTTGLPKAILHSNYSMLKAAGTISNHKIYDLNTLLFYTSFYWISAFLFLTTTILAGGKRIYSKTFTPESFVRIIEKYKVSFSFLSSTFAMQLTEDHVKNRDTNSLKDFLFGGSAVGEAHIMNLAKCFPNAGLRIGYGQTEAGGIATTFSKFSEVGPLSKPSSCGTVFFNVQIKIVDLETGRTLGPLEKGEICIKCETVFKGYLDINNSTEHPFDSDGFLKSGDMGYYDEDNCLYFTDRLKEMFKYQSWHVAPASVEIVIYEHPAVLEAVVVGVPHELDDHHPLALVILKNGCRATERDLLAFVDERVSETEKLRAGLRIVKRLPKTPTGKHARPQIKQIVISGNLEQLMSS